MSLSSKPPALRIRETSIGTIILEDCSQILYRVILSQILPIKTPVGVEPRLSFNVIVLNVWSPEEIRRKIVPKQIIIPTQLSDLKWEEVKVSSIEKAYEKVELIYDNVEIDITLETEPEYIVRTLEASDPLGNPIYYIKWRTRITIRQNNKVIERIV